MSTKSFVVVPLGNDPHTQGLFRVARVAGRAGITVHALAPGASLEALARQIQAHDPAYLGLSYRQDPAVALREFGRALAFLHEQGLLRRSGSSEPRRVALAGLPETMRAVQQTPGLLPCPVTTISEQSDRSAGVRQLLRFLDIRPERIEEVIAGLADELHPPRIPELDQLAAEIVASDYQAEPALAPPSVAARTSYIRRIEESELPLLRTHFGIPAPGIEATVDGVRALALAGAVDEVSLGSSDLSQRYFGHPEEFERRKNDGGVPYRTFDDLVALQQASRCGNFPGVKPYAHVTEMVPFVEACLRAGMLIGAHQAVPLFWFNELDGRGETPVLDSIREHQATVAALARNGIPVEMNDPNHFSSRWGHDTVFCADYGLITAVMLQSGVRDAVLQLQFNKPRETGDFADLAKMSAALELSQAITASPQGAKSPMRLWRETRTGIDSFDPDLGKARLQLARSTLLQMMLTPHVIHLVSYCEALHIAKVDDVIDSSRLVRRAVRVFRQHAPVLLPYLDHSRVVNRRTHLLDEATILLRAIASLGAEPALSGGIQGQATLAALAPRLAQPEVLHRALELGYMAAPGVFCEKYPAARACTTAPVQDGAFDCVDPATGRSIGERERLAALPVC